MTGTETKRSMRKSTRPKSVVSNPLKPPSRKKSAAPKKGEKEAARKDKHQSRSNAQKKPPAAKQTSPRKRSKFKEPPASGKPLQTYERLIAATGELLAEVGFERLTTNGICARAGLSPPALYHYFNDKYDILEVMARRLLKRQQDAYAAWLLKGGISLNPGNAVEALEEWLRIATNIIHSEPGAIWTMRTLRALPHLADIRLEAQRQDTDRMFELFRRFFPDVDPDLLWCRLRIRAEFGWTVDELSLEEGRIPQKILLREAARLLAHSLSDDAAHGS